MKPPSKVDIILGSGVIALASVIAMLVMVRFEPAYVKFDALEVVNERVSRGGLLYVVAETNRRPSDDCTNGVQVDFQDAKGSITRAQVPSRKLSGEYSKYDVIVPADAMPGKYQVRIREVVYCGGPPKIVDAPWLRFEIVPDLR